MIAAMKRNFSRFMFVAAAAMTFFGCQKPEVIAPEVAEEVMLTFASEKPAFDDATKTEWTGETIQWSAGDKISIAYTVDGNWQNASGNASGDAKLYKSEPLVEAMETAQFNVSAYFTGETEGTHVFYGVYPAPSETGFANAPVAVLTVAPSQNPKADSFDSNGDLMLGVSDVHTARPTADETISMKWERLVAHAVITLKNINGLTADETLEAITLTAQADANLVGQQKVNLLTKEVTKDNDAANVLKVFANNLTAVDGNVTFWACMLPETVTSLTVEVATDKATYTREITGIGVEFMKNARNLLSIKMDEAVRVANTVNENEVVDVLNNALTGITGTNYASWTGKTSVSDAVYAGQSAGGNESIQLRSNNNNSGVVTTVSGGFAKKVVVTWNSNTATGRTLNVYGSNSAYSNPTDLYDNAKAGTKLGTIVCGTSNELAIDGDYEYIGMRSNSSAMYIDEIKITWKAEVNMDPVLNVADDELELSAAESEGIVNLTMKNLDDAELDAAAYSDEECTIEAEWITAVLDGKAIAYTVDANDSEEERTAYIKVSAVLSEETTLTAVVTVTQAGKVVVEDNFEAGDYWIVGVKEGASRVMLPLASNLSYGYGQSEAITDNRTFAKNAFTFVEVEGGYNIKASDGRFYGTAATYKSFQITETPAVWTVSIQNDGTYLIKDASTGKTIKYGDGTYTTFGVYTESESNAAVYPVLVKADNPIAVELVSIAVTGQTTSFNVGDEFNFNGTVTATYNDGSTKTVTATSVSSPDMTVEGTPTVTVTYTEGTVTKTFEYKVNVVAESEEGGEGESEEIVTYKHVFTTKPSTGSVTLSDVKWTLAATNLNNYNNQYYAGVQFGASSKTGQFKLTSADPFTFDDKSKVKEIRLWLNTGGGTVTPTVTVGGQQCTQNGTITKNSSAGNDYTKASLVTFTPPADASGVVVIDVTSGKAGYFCAFEIDVY